MAVADKAPGKFGIGKRYIWSAINTGSALSVAPTHVLQLSVGKLPPASSLVSMAIPFSLSTLLAYGKYDGLIREPLGAATRGTLFLNGSIQLAPTACTVIPETSTLMMGTISRNDFVSNLPQKIEAGKQSSAFLLDCPTATGLKAKFTGPNDNQYNYLLSNLLEGQANGAKGVSFYIDTIIAGKKIRFGDPITDIGQVHAGTTQIPFTVSYYGAKGEVSAGKVESQLTLEISQY